MAGVQLVNVSKRFGKVQAMDHINLDVKSGEVLSLLGPSGCGKTTTLRSIVGLEEPSEGAIYIEQCDVLGIPIHKRQVGMVFQDYALFPHLTVQDNIAFGLKMQKMPAAVMRSKVAESLTLVRLAELPGIEGRYPHQLSGGQRQRVALARSLVTEPKVLLLDEPFGALDKKLRENMQVELRLIQRELQITMIFVTHDQEEALTLSDRIAIMRDGHVEQVGTPTEVYESPRSAFVADFIGVSNFLQGRVEMVQDGHLLVVTDKGLKLRVTCAPGRQVRKGDRLQLALRPEKVDISSSPMAAEANTCTGTIRHIVYLGTVTHYYVTSETGEAFVIFRQNQAASPSCGPLCVGDAIHLSWRPEHTLMLENDAVP
ncbi:MAG TPA: ABC transporter ATP-binding protein, partial [Candidatus Tectomicrobia bacterium]